MATRPGTKLVSKSWAGNGTTRLEPFEFNVDQTYTLVFTNLRLNFLKGGAVITETAATVNAISLNTTAVVTTSAVHGYSTGDQVYISVSSGMPEVNAQFYTITVLTTTTFELDGIDSTNFTAFGAGECNRVYSIATPYNGGDLLSLTVEQSNDVATITHPDYAVRELTRASDTSWSLTTITFGSDLAAPTGLSSVKIGTASGAANKRYRYKVTAATNERVESVASAAHITAISENALSTTYGEDITWNNVVNADFYVVYKEFSYLSGIYGWIGEADGTTERFIDYNFGPDMSYTPPFARTVFNATGEYPSTSAYHQERRFFAGMTDAPVTVNGSRLGNYSDFNRRRPSLSTDALEITFNAKRLNKVRHLMSLDKDLVAFTSGGVWSITPEGSALTPADINAKRHSGHGSGELSPILVGDTAVYLQASGTRVRDLRYDWDAQRYSGDDLTVLARHLFDSETVTVVDWAYQEEPYSIIWCVMSDGRLLSMTYSRPHQIAAWTQHELGNGGLARSVSVVREGNEDTVYIVAERQDASATWEKYIEQLASRRITQIEDYIGLDCASTYDGPASDVLYGFTHFEGMTVTALIDGAVYSDLTVTDGAIDLPAGTNAQTAHVGLQYNCDLETLEVPSSRRRTVQGRRKAAVRATLRVLDTRGLSWGKRTKLPGGTETIELFDFPERTQDMGYDPIPLQTATQAMSVLPGWTDTGQIYIRQAYPLPARILSITGELILDA
jgi:hypothetical protein